MKGINYAILAIAASVSLVFVNALQPNSVGATAAIAAWLVFPYAALALAVAFFANQGTWQLTFVAVSVVVAGGGLLFLTDVIFLHPDPQGGIAVIFTPIYQAVGIGVLVPA